VSLALLGLSIAIFSGNFGEHVVAAAGVSSGVVRQRRWSMHFRRRSPGRVLRQKEWTLLARDPWLMSQSLMQILYLLPPALLLWKSFQGGTAAVIVLVPVVVMAAGQLGGGLAWLSISGEDAPDLVATAPLPARRILWAKIEAVMGAIAVVFTPFILALAFASTHAALVAALGTLVSAASATMVQFCFRTQARRSQFRRRQTSSRIATFAEAFSSICWAGAAALVAAGSWLALVPVLIAIGILGGVRLIAPPPAN
jgi:ABC-2 type transport system permease protein